MYASVIANSLRSQVTDMTSSVWVVYYLSSPLCMPRSIAGCASNFIAKLEQNKFIVNINLLQYTYI